MSARKVLVTNWSAMAAKYGSGAAEVRAAIDGLIAADATRGITTEFVAVDDPAASSLGAAPVTNVSDATQVKAAIDAVYHARRPDALVILGSVDVIPRQPLRNPMPDGDLLALGDLPYACDQPFSTEPADFTKPTRVIGRLPDVTRVSDAGAFAAVLDTAASWGSSPASDYGAYLAVGAREWEVSTRLSVQQLFGAAGSLELSPPGAPPWPDPVMSRRTQFFNCHGATADPHFYGQDGAAYPIAHDAASVGGHVTRGTVVSAECCFGAELYDPADAGGAGGICDAYLRAGAFGFFGSSTIAYGPSDANAKADLICRFFLREVLDGRSLGEATLRARQAFVGTATILDPADLKTLAQFDLLGDPTVRPVSAPVQGPLTKVAALRHGIRRRRRSLTARGPAIAVTPKGFGAATDDLSSEILGLAGVAPKGQTAIATYVLESQPLNTLMKLFTVRPASSLPTRVHVVVTRPESSRQDIETVAGTVAVVAHERDGRVVSWRTLYAR